MVNDSRTFEVVRQGVVRASADRVRDALVDLRGWPAWSPWEGLDPDLRRAYSGAEQGVGAVYEWQGNRKAGAGRMEITHVGEDVVAIDIQFLKPFKSHGTIRFTLAPRTDGTTEVRWTMSGPKTIASKVFGLFVNMDRMVGRDFEKGLSQLDAHLAPH